MLSRPLPSANKTPWPRGRVHIPGPLGTRGRHRPEGRPGFQVTLTSSRRCPWNLCASSGGPAQWARVENSRPGAAAASQAPLLVLPFHLPSSREGRSSWLHFSDKEAMFQRVRDAPGSHSKHLSPDARSRVLRNASTPPPAPPTQASGATPPAGAGSQARWRPRTETAQAAHPASGGLSETPRGSAGQERALQLGHLVRDVCALVVTSSPGPGAREARCGCKPCSGQPGTPDKDAKTLTGPSAGWPRPSRPPRAAARGIRAAAPRGGRPGRERHSTRPAHPLHRCRGSGTFARTRRLSTCSSLSLPLSRNIEVTPLAPGWLKRPWAQLPGGQHRPHLLRQKYLLPQWPQLVTPFL